jgi:hypothetical protein
MFEKAPTIEACFSIIPTKKPRCTYITCCPMRIISIDNVDREMVLNIKRAVTSRDVIKVTYRPYLSTDLTSPHYDPPLHLTLRDIVADVFKVTGKARFSDLANISFPNELYTATRFPGLVR